MFETPPELIADIEAFERRWEEISLRDWLGRCPINSLEACQKNGSVTYRAGEQPSPLCPHLKRRSSTSIPVAITASGTVNAEKLMELETALRGLHPWRKGPYSLLA